MLNYLNIFMTGMNDLRATWDAEISGVSFFIQDSHGNLLVMIEAD